ncbi:AGAP008193-PA-like protein [Anopheles sinensis]|uniref:AGAP008193-PA-like protein n=1 Tax=Anopheles sinensis TaxID=74873 RepID=A0A084VQM7_ANOSI|nr:AGAP008193-PA-like protein [Anopheles sinensis]
MNQHLVCNARTIGAQVVCNVGNRFEHGFLLVSTEDGIYRVPIDGGKPYQIVTYNNDNWDYENYLYRDCAGGRVYWAESSNQTIYSAKYDGTDKKVFFANHDVQSSVLTVDWISGRVYRIPDMLGSTIAVISIENPNVHAVLNTRHHCQLSDIVVDPLRGKLYWTCFKGLKEGTSLYWSNLDMSDEELLLKFSGASEMHVLMATGEVCYPQYHHSTLKCFDPYSKQSRTIAENLRLHPYDITETMYYVASGDE